MWRALILWSCLCGASAYAAPEWRLGAGFEIKAQREINPDYTELRFVGQIFSQMQFSKWGAHLEASRQSESSKSGSLSIKTESLNFGAWARYRFGEESIWRPYLASGLGAYFDNVTSKFLTAEDERSGIRYYWGLGGGISAVFWQHVLVEAEGRMLLLRDSKDPMFGGLMRVGYAF